MQPPGEFNDDASSDSGEATRTIRHCGPFAVPGAAPHAADHEADEAGLLAPERIELMLREQLRAEKAEQLKIAHARLAAEALTPMTPEEIQSEIETYRHQQRRASGS